MDNPYVREIKLFDPGTDLDVDRAGVRRTHRKKAPVMPSEGLLDTDIKSEPAPAAPAANSKTAAPVRSAPASPAASQGEPVATPKEQAPVQGDAPEIIEGDFPEPLDF